MENAAQNLNYPCKLCEFHTTSGGDLKRHIKVKHLRIPNKQDKPSGYTCPHCGYTRANFYFVKQHILVVHEKKEPKPKVYKTQKVDKAVAPSKFSCNQCDYTTNRAHLLRTHILAIHEKKKDFKCSVCSSAYVTRFALNSHIKESHLTDRIVKDKKCEQCNFTTHSQNSLTNHFTYMHKDKDVKCQICDYVTSAKHRLNRHIKDAHDKRSQDQECPNCDYVTTRKAYLIVHLKRVHLKLNENKWICPTCSITCKDKKSLTYHIKGVHKKVKDLKCGWPYCDYAATQPGVLQRHIKVVHEKMRGIKCSYSYCNYVTDRPSRMKSHIANKHSNCQPVEKMVVELLRARRQSVFIDPRQKHELEKFFADEMNPTGDEVEKISNWLELPKYTVYNWFSGKRQRERGKVTKKGPRFTINQEKRLELEKSFATNKKPTVEVIEELSTHLDLTKETVYRWFCRRRSEEQSEVGTRIHIFTRQQRQELERSFAKSERPTKDHMEELSKQLGLTQKTVNGWFSRKRCKENKGANKEQKIIQKQEQKLFQNQELERSFSTNTKPTEEEMEELSKQLGLGRSTIQSWFSRRRGKQWQELERVFETNKKPTGEDIEDIARQLVLPKETVNRWFCQRRFRERRKEGASPLKVVVDKEKRFELERLFETNRRPNGQMILELSKRLGLTYKTVYNFFSRRRCEERKPQEKIVSEIGNIKKK